MKKSVIAVLSSLIVTLLAMTACAQESKPAVNRGGTFEDPTVLGDLDQKPRTATNANTGDTLVMTGTTLTFTKKDGGEARYALPDDCRFSGNTLDNTYLEVIAKEDRSFRGFARIVTHGECKRYDTVVDPSMGSPSMWIFIDGRYRLRMRGAHARCELVFDPTTAKAQDMFCPVWMPIEAGDVATTTRASLHTAEVETWLSAWRAKGFTASLDPIPYIATITINEGGHQHHFQFALMVKTDEKSSTERRIYFTPLTKKCAWAMLGISPGDEGLRRVQLTITLDQLNDPATTKEDLILKLGLSPRPGDERDKKE